MKKEKWRWAKFLCVWTQTKLINKFFKNSNLNISFKTENSVGEILTKRKTLIQEKFNICDVLQSACQDCNTKYIRPTGRHFHIRFQENFRDLNYGNGKSIFAHLLENKLFIRSMEFIMEVLQITRKGSIINNIYIIKQNVTTETK